MIQALKLSCRSLQLQPKKNIQAVALPQNSQALFKKLKKGRFFHE
jgi:hypothetical protein